MVTRKRKIETEQDRFGGFEDAAPVEKSVFRTPDTINIPDNRMYSRTTTREPEIIFSDRETTRAYPQPEQTRTRRSTALAEEDLMPSIKTMSYAEQKKKVDSREKMEGKTKVMLAVYMLVVVLLAAIVIGTGIVINSLNTNINRINGEIESSKGFIIEQNADLGILNDPFAISGKAQSSSGLNMEEISPNAYTDIELIPFEEETAVVAKANGFDRFCDWVKKVLGG